MHIQVEKCTLCDKKLRSNSEELYWHIKLHQLEDEKVCNHKRVWEMTSVSTRGCYKEPPRDEENGIIVTETTYTTGMLWWKKEHKFSDFVDMPDVYDSTELNKLLEDGWEPFQTKDWSVTLKRLKPCEECKKV